MKKMILLGLSIFLVNLTYGQGFIKGIMERLSYGVSGGANYGNFYKADFKTKGIVGFQAGATLAFRINEHLSIQEDLLFLRTGANISGDQFTTEHQIRLSYFSIPILVRYQTSAEPFFEIGGQPNLLIKGTKIPPSGKFTKDLDFGVVGGLGYRFQDNYLSGFGVNVRYYLGLSKAGNFQEPTVRSNFKIQRVQAGIFYQF